MTNHVSIVRLDVPQTDPVCMTQQRITQDKCQLTSSFHSHTHPVSASSNDLEPHAVSSFYPGEAQSMGQVYEINIAQVI